MSSSIVARFLVSLLMKIENSPRSNPSCRLHTINCNRLGLTPLLRPEGLGAVCNEFSTSRGVISNGHPLFFIRSIKFCRRRDCKLYIFDVFIQILGVKNKRGQGFCRGNRVTIRHSFFNLSRRLPIWRHISIHCISGGVRTREWTMCCQPIPARW